MLKLFYMPGACSLATHIILREIGEPFELERVGRDKKTEMGARFPSAQSQGLCTGVAAGRWRNRHGEHSDPPISRRTITCGAYLLPKHGIRERLRVDQLMVYVSTEIHKGYSPAVQPGAVRRGEGDLPHKLAERHGLIENSCPTAAHGLPANSSALWTPTSSRFLVGRRTLASICRYFPVSSL